MLFRKKQSLFELWITQQSQLFKVHMSKPSKTSGTTPESKNATLVVENTKSQIQRNITYRISTGLLIRITYRRSKTYYELDCQHQGFLSTLLN